MGVPANASDDDMQAFVDEHGLRNMPQLVDDDGSVWTRFGVAYQPAWVFVPPEGDIEVVAGALDTELPTRLDAFLEGEP